MQRMTIDDFTKDNIRATPRTAYPYGVALESKTPDRWFQWAMAQEATVMEYIGK